MKEFIENTHIVIKREDIDKYLTTTEKVLLDNVLSSISIGRAREGKNQNNTYYICNTDEPYADKVLNVILNQGATDGWIPCSERLPENNKVVLCWVKSTTIASGETYIIGSCDRGFWFLQTYEIGHHHFPVKDYEVVAWQQLPEPLKPKEEQHDMSGWKGAFMNTFLSRN